jgi:hypothetical protein
MVRPLATRMSDTDVEMVSSVQCASPKVHRDGAKAGGFARREADCDYVAETSVISAALRL